MSQELYSKVGILESKVDTHEKRIAKVEEKNDAITRLSILYENQERRYAEREVRDNEREKKQQEQMDKFSEAMDEVVASLTSISHSQEQMQVEIRQIGNRVAEIEQKDDESKLDLGKLFKHVLLTAIPSIVVAYILIKLNLK